METGYGEDPKKNDWDRMINADVVLGLIQRINRVEIINAIKKMKLEKVAGPSEVNTETVAASGKIGVEFMMKLCQRVLNEKGIPDKWKTSVVVPIYKKRLRDLVNLDELRFRIMPGKGTVDAFVG